MHELSVAQSLVELIEAQLMAAKLEDARVSMVKVAIGAGSAVVPEALRSAFGPASAGSSAAGATLVIELVPVVVWCDACAAERLPADQRLVCPVCGNRTPTILRGKELELVSLEFLDDDVEPSHSPAAPTPPAADADTTDSAGAAADPEEQ